MMRPPTHLQDGSASGAEGDGDDGERAAGLEEAALPTGRDSGPFAAHGRGKRCQQEGCPKSAHGSTRYYAVHGGGKRCQQEGCPKSAIGSTGYCLAHGGGKRCQQEGCPKSATGIIGYSYGIV
jgi:hypothetical protein